MKTKKILIYCLLTAIVLIAGFLRLYKLTEFPDGFNADEAAIGYNAYSLMQTGMDEHGHHWPLAFESFGDFKAPLYVYIIMPFVGLMGLSEWAVRLPSALFGVGTVFLIFFLARKIFDSDTIGLLAAFFLAISPWHLQFSRGGWEVNVATFFITLGVYAFIKAMDQKQWFWVSLVSFLASMYTYHSPKIVIPLLGVGILWFYGKDLWAKRKSLLVPLIITVVLGVPLVLSLTGKTGGSRFAGVSIFADSGPFWGVNEARGEHTNPDGPAAKMLHNKVVGYGLDFLKNYSDHYTPLYLFFDGDKIDRNNIPETGVMYVIDGIFVVLGLLFVLVSDKRHKGLLLWWLAIAPTAASITFQTPHALRSHNMVIPLVILSAAGVYYAVLAVQRRARVLLVPVILLVLLGYGFGFAKYLHEYYVHIPQERPLANNYGFDQLVPYVEGLKGQYDKILMTDRYDQPYILFLFFAKTPPQDFQGHHVLTERDKFNFSTVRNFEKYEFRAITPEDLVQSKQTLIVGTDADIQDDDPRIINVIRFPNGKPAFKIIKT